MGPWGQLRNAWTQPMPSNSSLKASQRRLGHEGWHSADEWHEPLKPLDNLESGHVTGAPEEFLRNIHIPHVQFAFERSV